MKWPKPAKDAASYAYEQFDMASFTIGVEAADTINVAVQLKDARGNNVGRRVHGRAYLSDASSGAGITGTATTSALAVGTNGNLLDIPVTGKSFDFVTDASGRIDIDIIQTAALTYHLVILAPDGKIIVSDAITFA